MSGVAPVLVEQRGDELIRFRTDLRRDTVVAVVDVTFGGHTGGEFGFHFGLDLGAVVRHQDHHVHVAEETVLVTVFRTEVADVHAGFAFERLETIEASGQIKIHHTNHVAIGVVGPRSGPRRGRGTGKI